MKIIRHDFTQCDELVKTLTNNIVDDLKAAISRDGIASIAVSGGSTPKKLFLSLGARSDINWSKVTATLVDERWVDENSPRSNARLVKDYLLIGPASVATFIPLYSGGDMPDEKLIAKTNLAQKEVKYPFDVVILGMGTDGHTASFFPGADQLDEALENDGPALAINAPGAGEPRVTLTLPYLCASKNLYLHIEGETKRAVLERALGNGAINELPVRAILRQEKVPVNIYYCPQNQDRKT